MGGRGRRKKRGSERKIGGGGGERRSIIIIGVRGGEGGRGLASQSVPVCAVSVCRVTRDDSQAFESKTRARA